jgi:hypothetical protein
MIHDATIKRFVKEKLKIMKKSILLVLFIFSLFNISYSQTPSWQWANSAGGTVVDLAYSVTADSSGNTYVTGSFSSSSITFGSITLTNAYAGNRIVYLVKYDSNGDALWAKKAEGTNNDANAFSVAVDTLGNAYITGYFQSTTLSFGTITLTNTSGFSNLFLAKYDTNGNVLWAEGAGGTNTNAMAYSVAVDTLGNSYVAGEFSGSSITIGSTILTSAGTYDVFIAKYDAAGNVVWAKRAGSTSDDEARSIAVDASGNSYITGFFQSTTITFGATILTNTNINYTDIFIAKYDTNGNEIWAKSAGGTSWDMATSISVDALGNSYLAGNFSSPLIVFGSTNLITAGVEDIFIAKYDTIGNVIWAKSAGGASSDYATGVAVDSAGNAYLTGYFQSPSLIFGSTSLINVGSKDIFLSKYNANGTELWATSIGSTGQDFAYSVAVDASGHSYIAGFFDSSTINFGSTTLTNAGSGSGSNDIYIAKLGNDTLTGINELSNILNFSIFPNPASDNIKINIPRKSEIEILNIEGKIIKSFYTDEELKTIDISDFASGVYIIRAQTDSGITTVKFIKE